MARDCMGATPLHYAVKVAQEDAVKMLTVCVEMRLILTARKTCMDKPHISVQLEEIAFASGRRQTQCTGPPRARPCTMPLRV